jgi:hypothetical protein
VAQKHNSILKKVSLNQIQTAIDQGDFIKSDDLLKHYKASLDNLVVKNLEVAGFLLSYLKTSVHNFSIIKSPLIISLSNYIDKTEVRKLLAFSSDHSSSNSATKLAALNCYLDNKNASTFDPNNNCLKNLLSTYTHLYNTSDPVNVLVAHTKCEPGVDCNNITSILTSFYNSYPFVTKIMQIGAKFCLRDNCNIVLTYDDNYSTKSGGWLDTNYGGYYDNAVSMFVCAKSDLHYGAIIHELNHYVMNSLYHFNSCPYPDPSLLFQPVAFHSQESAFKNMVGTIDILLQTKLPQNGEQAFVKNITEDLKYWYPVNQIDGELVVRYPEMLVYNISASSLDYYLQPLVDYYNADLIPDIENYLLT